MVTFPRSDIFSTVPFSPDGYQFKPLNRQEYSRQTDGITRGKSFGSSLWMASFATIPLPIDDALDFEAMLNSLDGVIHSFYAGDLRRPYPRRDPKGALLTGGPTLDLDFTTNQGYVGTSASGDVFIRSIGTDGKSLSLKGMRPDYQLSRGDYLHFDYGPGPSRAYHQIMDPLVTADSLGDTVEFEVRPHIRPGAQVDDTVVLARPSAIMALMPGSIQQSMINGLDTVISFQAIEIITAELNADA